METVASTEPSVTSSPLGDLDDARLELPRGTRRLRLHVLSPAGAWPYRDAPALFRACFEGDGARVGVDGGTVRITYLPFRFGRPHPAGTVALQPAVPWTVMLGGGACEVTGDLRGLRLRGVEIAGGAAAVRLQLPRPTGLVPIVISGGADGLELLRPADVPVRVRVTGGASELRVDNLALHAVGGEFYWESPSADSDKDRYDVTVRGGARGMVIAGETA